ncbi:MAG: hypothetical protein K2Y27_02330 [Xanthobacteraceae bacterium]|nr:hypothetical protein [Xanthobacteraceae bacterium]
MTSSRDIVRAGRTAVAERRGARRPSGLSGELGAPELVAYATAHPGKLNYGSGGVGNISQLAAELFRLRTGVDIVHVPLKGASEVFTAILGGQVHLYFGDTPEVTSGAARLNADVERSARFSPRVQEVIRRDADRRHQDRVKMPLQRCLRSR